MDQTPPVGSRCTETISNEGQAERSRDRLAPNQYREALCWLLADFYCEVHQRWVCSIHHITRHWEDHPLIYPGWGG